MDFKGKGKGKARYQPLSRDPEDMEMPPLSTGGTARFPTRYLKENMRLDDEIQADDADDEKDVLYHEKQWPANRRVWRKRWCEWRIVLLISLATMVFGTIVFAISAGPATAPPQKTIAVHPVSFGKNLGCTALHYYNDPQQVNRTIGNTLFVPVPVSGSEFSVSTIGSIATGTIELSWDPTLPADSARLAFSIASQSADFFDFGLQTTSASVPGVHLEVYDESNDMSNCLVYNITLRLPWEVNTLTLDMASRAQVRIRPPTLGAALDDGSGLPTEPHTLEQFIANFTSERPGNILVLSEQLRTIKASISMQVGELTGSWPMPKQLDFKLGPEVEVGAGLEFFPFDN